MNGFAIFQGNRSQQTFLVALLLLGVIAAGELVGALFLSARRTRELESQLASSSFSGPARPFRANGIAPLPVPGQSGAPSEQSANDFGRRPNSVSGTLLEVARGLRERGDTTNAIAKLQQAAAIDPKNGEVLAELALTYESMQLFDRSNETWRRLQSLGAQAGPLYALAQLKLQVGVPAAPNSIAAANSPALSGAAPVETAVIPDGSVFGIAEITPTLGKDSEAETKVRLRVAVKRRPEVRVDHTKVKIQVFFYDVVDNDQVVLTDAEVSYEWITPGHDWANTDTEVLEVTYLRPRNAGGTPASSLVPDSVEKAQRAAKDPGKTEPLPASESGQRSYLGYIVRVYYKDQLQAVRADPTRLLNLFPPPLTAPPQG